MKALLAAAGVFTAVLALLSVVWTLVLGVAMEPVWSQLPAAADPGVGAAVLLLAVASGLALYAALYARALRALGIAAVRRHLLTTGLVPPAAAALAAWIALSSMRIGW